MGMLDGRTALVTGAGRGIGRGIAMAMAAEGAKVVVNDLGAKLDGEGVDASPADVVVREIKELGGTAAANYGSVADWDQAHAMVEQAMKLWGRVDQHSHAPHPHEDARAGPLVPRVVGGADRAATSDHGHAVRRPAAQDHDFYG